MRRKLFILIALGLFIVSDLDAQRRTSQRRSKTPEKTEEEKKDLILEKYGFASREELVDYLLTKDPNRSEKKTIERYRGGAELSAREMNRLVALLDKHRGVQVAEGEEEEPTSGRRRAARSRRESGRERSARESESEMPDMSDLPGRLAGVTGD
jgi:hypothetical protein